MGAPGDRPDELLGEARDGSRGALARLLSIAEHGGVAARAVSAVSHAAGGDAYTVGITGAPGAGKSTLTNGLVAAARAGGERVAVLAIDPSSPYTGGAILGDRVRMADHALDPGVFIRSMATRGHLGGLSVAAPDAVRVLDAVGFAWILVETVGVGQVEVEIAGEADSTVVVVNPGWGDAVQANKAGLLEVADVFVVNKADRDGAVQTRRELEQMLELSRETGGRPDPDWTPPVLGTVATTGDGVAELWRALGEHRAHLEASGGLAHRRRVRAESELERVLAQCLLEQARALVGTARFEELRDEVVGRRLDPWAAAGELLAMPDLDR